GAGYNLRKILGHLALLCARSGINPNRLLMTNSPNLQLGD
ncbi:hypothetical protein SAMN05421863_11059, partial [Nitrosomonas communis]